MINPEKKAHDLIYELAEKAAKEVNLNDPDFRQLIHELNALVEAENEIGYYSVKDVAELFDVSKQTVYKWIAEDKIDYKKDRSPGKAKRNGYHIPKTQFRTIEQMNKIDATFHKRREKEMADIPDTGFDPGKIFLPKSETQVSEEE